jgi:tryptophan 6-halogenase
MRTIAMRVGRAERTWERNCVAIGLAAGFVEPLEASAIYSVELSLKWLYNYFPDADFSPALAARYNARTAALYDEIVEYIALHYRVSTRQDDPYWVAQRNDMAIPDRLAANLELWRHTLPVQADVLPTNYFDHNTYTSALFGKGFYSGGTLKPERMLDRAEWESTKAMIARSHASAVRVLPTHRALVDSLRT